MRVLADTNIVLRYIHQDFDRHAEVEAAVDRLVGQGTDLVMVPQVLFEYWVVATRPYGNGGLSLTSEEASRGVRLLTQTFPCLPDPPTLLGTWLALVEQHQVLGRQGHDARLAAAIQVHGLGGLLTLNEADFKRYGIPLLTLDPS